MKKKLKELVQTDSIDLIIVDELLGCIVNELITEDELIAATEHITNLLSLEDK